MQRSLLWLSGLIWLTDGVEFEPFQRSEEYKCGAFLQSSVNDQAMTLFYSWNNELIRTLSSPFPHEKLLDREALLGNIESWKRSFMEQHTLWMEHEKWWLVLSASVVLVSAVFTVFYLLYRCCACLCRRGKKQRSTDRKRDGCKRVMLNAIVACLVIVNVFASVALLISTQYASYGIEELPRRLNNCVDDLSVYKKETDERIRKLLIDDFHRLNQSLARRLDGVGEEVVTKVKRETGAYLVDSIVERSQKIPQLKAEVARIQADQRNMTELRSLLQKKLSKLRESERELVICQGDPNPTRSMVCQRTRAMVQQLISKTLDDEELEDVIPPGILPALDDIERLQVERTFREILSMFHVLQDNIQGLVDDNKEVVFSGTKSTSDTLFQLAEDISGRIKTADFNFLYDALRPVTANRDRYRDYIIYSWYISLIVAGIFAFIALTFLLGLFYGCCGRRPTFYNDDCCVRSTGSKFYSCGIWMCLTFMFAFAIVTSVMMLVGANISNLVCHPLQDPLRRPDFLSLLDRMVDVYGVKGEDAGDNFALFTSQRMPAEIIRECNRNSTFYSMFGMEDKFKFLAEGGPGDEYEQLKLRIREMARIRLPQNQEFGVRMLYDGEKAEVLSKLGQISIPTIEDSAIQKIRAQLKAVDLEPATHSLRKLLAEKSSVSVPEAENVVNHLNNTKTESQALVVHIDDLAQRLESLRKNLSELKFNTEEISSKLQHAEQMISSDLPKHLTTAAQNVTDGLAGEIEQYVRHVNHSMSVQVSSCEPNGVWFAMLISILLTIPLIMLTTSLSRLYAHMHPFPRYTVMEPGSEAFATDVYGTTRTKTLPYSSSKTYSGYQELYPPPYMGTRSRT
ncbi:Protein PRMN-1 [Aphelenchoides avenae]|nr:Protein PRMN-1 [Aphelenchus avenae]